jgi:hypothetical protein
VDANVSGPYVLSNFRVKMYRFKIGFVIQTTCKEYGHGTQGEGVEKRKGGTNGKK